MGFLLAFIWLLNNVQSVPLEFAKIPQKLVRREDECNALDIEEYDLALHIGVIFIIMAFSALGCGFTAASKRMPFRIPEIVIDIGRHFGTGVIISTAFIHMLQAAVESLSSKCASEAFQSYGSSAVAITMATTFVMHLIEFFVVGYFSTQAKEKSNENISNSIESTPPSTKNHTHCHLPISHSRKLTTYILELGILSHSVFIGLSLGVTSGTAFTPLLVAIVFHQFFEGIGLGARISDLHFDSIIKPVIMVVMFSITTSIGIAIGIGIRSVYSPTSITALDVQGIFDAISAGILIYTGLVDLIGREMSYNSEFGSKSIFTRIISLLSVYIGALAMGIIGIWA